MSLKYTLTGLAVPGHYQIPSHEIGEAISRLKLNSSLIGIFYTFKPLHSEGYQFLQNPPEPIPPMAQCLMCQQKGGKQTYGSHNIDCNFVDDTVLMFNTKFVNDLSSEHQKRYLENRDPETGEALYIDIFNKPGVDRVPKKGLIQLPWFTFNIENTPIKAKLYPDTLKFEIQKINGNLLDSAFKTISQFFINFFKTYFEIHIQKYIQTITQIETHITLPESEKIDKETNNWNSYVSRNSPLERFYSKKSDTISNMTFLTQDGAKLTVHLKTRAIQIILNRGTKLECAAGDFNPNCVLNESIFIPYVNFINEHVPRKAAIIEFKRRINKVFNTYTSPDWKFNREFPQQPEGTSRGHPIPHEFWGSCPPSHIFQWQGKNSKNKLNNREVYYPDCKAIKSPDNIIFERQLSNQGGISNETTLEELKSTINHSKPYKKGEPIQFRDKGKSPLTLSPWMKWFTEGFMVDSEGNPTVKPVDITSGIGPGILKKKGQNLTKTTLSKDPNSGVYKEGRQSRHYHGDDSMEFDSRIWPGLVNLEFNQVKSFAKCMLSKIRIINPAELHISQFTVRPLYYIENFVGNIYNIPLNSIFVKVVIMNNLATIIERDTNVLFQNVLVTEFENFQPTFKDNHELDYHSTYGFIDKTTFIPLLESTKIKFESSLKTKSITKTQGEKECIVEIGSPGSETHLPKVQLAFENPDFIRNELVKTVTMDFYFTGSHLEYHGETNPECKLVVESYRDQLQIGQQFYKNAVSIPYSNKFIKSKSGWFRFRFAWFDPKDPRYNDLELYYNPIKKQIKLDPSFILEPIRKIKEPRYTYIESWNTFYRIILSFSELYSKICENTGEC